MRIEAFEIVEPVPELRDPHALVTLRPWVDVGRVGRHTLTRLEAHFKGQELGKLARPGTFYDFTRYRPRIRGLGAERRFTIPNTTLLYAKRDEPPDFLFIHLLEPHAFGEDFCHSVLEVLKYFGVKRYCQVGSVSDAVPHTRPLLVSGNAPSDISRRFKIYSSRYEGPTSLTFLITQEAPKLGIETMNFYVRLPYYVQLDEDYAGVARLLEILCSIYHLPSHLIDSQRGQKQYQEIDVAVSRNPEVKNLVQKLEVDYDARAKEEGALDSSSESPALSPEVERFLRDIERRPGE